MLHATRPEFRIPVPNRFHEVSKGVYSLRAAVVETDGFSVAWNASEFFNRVALVGVAIAAKPEKEYPVRDRVEGGALVAGGSLVGLPDRVADCGEQLLGLLKSWNSETLLRFQAAQITTLRLDHCKMLSMDVLFKKASLVRLRFDTCMFGGVLDGGSAGRLALPSHLEKLHIRTPIGPSLEFDFSQACSLVSLKVITQDEASLRPGMRLDAFAMSREQVRLDESTRGEFPASLLKCVVNRGVTLERHNLVPAVDDDCLGLWALTIRSERSFPHDALRHASASSINGRRCTIRSIVPLSFVANLTRLYLGESTFEEEALTFEPPSTLSHLELNSCHGGLEFRMGPATALASLIVKSHTPALDVSCIDRFPGEMRVFTIDGVDVLPFKQTADGVTVANADLASGPSLELVLASLNPKRLLIKDSGVGEMAQFFSGAATTEVTFEGSQFEAGATLNASGAAKQILFQGNEGQVSIDLGDTSCLAALSFIGNEWEEDHSWFQQLPASLSHFSVEGENTIGADILGRMPSGLSRFSLNPGHLSVRTARRRLKGCDVTIVEAERHPASRRFGELFTAQPEAVRVIQGLLRGIEAASSSSGPIQSMLLVGQGGTGKRSTAMAIATAVGVDVVELECDRFADEDCLTRFRSDSFVDQLEDVIQSGKKFVLLLNRFDEGHEFLRDLFLSMLDGENGALKVAGRTIVCSNALVVLTASTGGAEVDRLMGGVLPDFAAAQAAARDALEDLCGERMRERIDRVLPYGPVRS